MSMYSDGTVDITAGKTIAVGNNTAFTTYVEAGDLFKLSSQSGIYDIAAVNSATRITLTARYSSTTYQTSRADEAIVTTDATLVTYTATLDNLPLIQETLSVNGSDETWTDDDGSGTLTAAASPSGSSGSIDYDTGALSLTYSASPTEDYAVTASYTSGDDINGAAYQIVTDFTTNYILPELSLNDINFQHIYTKAMRLLDAAIYDASINTLICATHLVARTTASMEHVTVASLNVGGDGTNYIELAEDGVKFHGDAREIRHVTVDSGTFAKPASNYPAVGQEGLYATLDFSKSTNNSVYHVVNMPYRREAGSDIQMHLDWLGDTNAASSNHFVRWGVKYASVEEGASVNRVDASFTQDASTLTAIAGLMQHEHFDTQILGSLLAEHDQLSIRIYRDASNDDYDDEARLVSVHLHFTQDKLGSPI